MRAILTVPGGRQRLAIDEVARPEAGRDEALVEVRAISLNAGEVRSALAAERPYVPGWDFAGRVVAAAADGTSPRAGTDVVGSVRSGAWAEFVCVRGSEVAELPAGVSFAEAACLPVAGLTALCALDAYGCVLGRRVLITGASGGVGRFAAQLASLAGASVFLISRRAALPELLAKDGVRGATVFHDIRAAAREGQYDLILDSVGGESLAGALDCLAANGTCINFGNSSNAATTFDVRPLYLKGDTTLRGLYLGAMPDGRGRPLARLAALLAGGRLKAPIDRTLPWTEIAEAARCLAEQRVDGKIVLAVS